MPIADLEFGLRYFSIIICLLSIALTVRAEMKPALYRISLVASVEGPIDASQNLHAELDAQIDKFNAFVTSLIFKGRKVKFEEKLDASLVPYKTHNKEKFADVVTYLIDAGGCDTRANCYTKLSKLNDQSVEKLSAKLPPALLVSIPRIFYDVFIDAGDSYKKEIVGDTVRTIISKDLLDETKGLEDYIIPDYDLCEYGRCTKHEQLVQ